MHQKANGDKQPLFGNQAELAEQKFESVTDLPPAASRVVAPPVLL
jgi:hypothetical protein